MLLQPLGMVYEMGFSKNAKTKPLMDLILLGDPLIFIPIKTTLPSPFLGDIFALKFSDRGEDNISSIGTIK